MTAETSAGERTGWLTYLDPREMRIRVLVGIAAVVAFGLLPLVVDDLTVLKLTSALFLGVFAMSWDFTSGYTGEISFGHAFFFGIGGYTSAVLNVNYGVDPLLSIPVGVVLAAIGGLLLGGPALRLEGPYLSLITLTAPLILLKIFVVYSGTFGGEVGIIGVQNISVDPMTNFYMAFVLFTGVLLLFFAITRSDTGLVFTAIREDEDAVRAAGIDPAKFKLFSFVLSAAVGGLAGGLLVHSTAGTATPSLLLALTVNIMVIAASVIGGMGTIVGAAAGGIAYFMFRNYLSNVEVMIPGMDVAIAEVDLILFYLIAVAVMFFLPQGIIPWLIERAEGFRSRGGGGEPTTAATDGGRTPLESAVAKFRGGIRSIAGDRE